MNSKPQPTTKQVTLAYWLERQKTLERLEGGFERFTEKIV